MNNRCSLCGRDWDRVDLFSCLDCSALLCVLCVDTHCEETGHLASEDPE